LKDGSVDLNNGSPEWKCDGCYLNCRRRLFVGNGVILADETPLTKNLSEVQLSSCQLGGNGYEQKRSCNLTLHPPMAQSETSFADRLQRARQIHSATLGFVPVFAPADASLAGAAFSTFLQNADTANLSVANALIDWKDTVASRSKLLAELKARVLRANARVKSNPSWANHVPTIKALADKIRGQRTPAPKPPTEEGAAPAAKREQGDQSYADIKSHLDQFTAALRKITNYDLNAPVDITTASLSATASQLQAQSSLIASHVQALSAARAARLAMYDGPSGLGAKLKAIKESVKSQYGNGSMQHNQIKSLRI
jgi:hypothetical protein